MSYSGAIDDVIEAAAAEGNKVAEISTGWTKVRQVVYMQKPLSSSLRELFKDDSRLRAFSTDPTPHDKADEGFVDDNEKVAISFPREN
jgi:hypothetical protein